MNNKMKNSRKNWNNWNIKNRLRANTWRYYHIK